MGSLSVMYSHGHLGLMKKSTDQIINAFGYKDHDYVVFITAHVHNAKSTVTNYASEKFDIVQDCSGGHIHLVSPSLTTGNEYSTNLGHRGQYSGFLTITESISGKANYSMYSV
jgi:hypothetical protein